MTHRDTYFPVKLGDLLFYQVMVPLSVKGRDFSDGGRRDRHKARRTAEHRRDRRARIDRGVRRQDPARVDGVGPQDVMNFKTERGQLAGQRMHSTMMWV